MSSFFNFSECWDGEPNNRPDINKVVDRLEAIIAKTTTITTECYPTDEQRQELGSDNINVSSNFSNSLLHNFNEIKSTTTSIYRQDANENILDFGIIMDELVNLIFK